MTLARAVATIGGWTVVSRIAGFARDVLTAAAIGAGPAADAFIVALKLPNALRRLSAEGAFGVAFVPLFSTELATHGHRPAQSFAEEAQAIMVAVLVPLTVILIAAMPWVIRVLAPGFGDDPARLDLAVDLARLTFPYLVLVSLVALYGGVLNSLGHFAPFAAAPVAFNLSLIAVLLAARTFDWPAAPALAAGVTASGVLQVAGLAWVCRAAGMPIRPVRPRLTPRMKRLWRLMTPGVLGAGISQISSLLTLVLASLLPTGAVSYLYYADRLNQLPLGIVGIALGSALLPVLSRTGGWVVADTAGCGRTGDFGRTDCARAVRTWCLWPGSNCSYRCGPGRFRPRHSRCGDGQGT
ncbi:putative peptidoglycan lipid II flippase [uncultured Gammaproteobacteria bacterium]